MKPIPVTLSPKSIELDEKLINPHLTSCPFCLSANLVEYGVEVYKKPSVHLLECNNCKAVFVDRMPTDEALNKYYSNYYERFRDVHMEQAAAVTHWNTTSFARHIARLFFKYNRENNINLLDFGGGDGSLGVKVKNALSRFGVKVENVYLIDISNVVPVQGCIKLSGLDSRVVQHFDLVLASAVIEHLNEPLKYLRELMAKSSYIYFRTPFVAPLIRLASKLSIPLDFIYPMHVSDLGAKFYSNLNKCWPEIKIITVYSDVSSVQTTFTQNFFMTAAAHLFKFPYKTLRLLGLDPNLAAKIWPYVGGWEAIIKILK